MPELFPRADPARPGLAEENDGHLALLEWADKHMSILTPWERERVAEWRALLEAGRETVALTPRQMAVMRTLRRKLPPDDRGQKAEDRDREDGKC